MSEHTSPTKTGKGGKSKGEKAGKGKKAKVPAKATAKTNGQDETCESAGCALARRHATAAGAVSPGRRQLRRSQHAGPRPARHDR